jgi:D-alanyl-D-alanine carboxypeptidase
MSYPAHKETVTGYIYEPWHFRYVGIDIANHIHETGETIQEYLNNTPSTTTVTISKN